MKFTFFQFVVEFDFFAVVHNKSHMLFMFFHIFWENRIVIDVIDHKIIRVGGYYVIRWGTWWLLGR
jgi:hypothetical protein